jgi:hypothetical protein
MPNFNLRSVIDRINRDELVLQQSIEATRQAIDQAIQQINEFQSPMPTIAPNHIINHEYLISRPTIEVIIDNIIKIERTLTFNGFFMRAHTNAFFNNKCVIYVTSTGFVIDYYRGTLGLTGHDFFRLIGYLTVYHLMPSKYRNSEIDNRGDGDSSHIDQYEF